MKEYRGYAAAIEFDEDEEIFQGEVLGIRDVVTFQGRSVRELKKSFRDSVDDYLEYCAERGEEPDKPFSGRLLLRLPPEMHRSLYTAAKKAGMSLNAWILEQLDSMEAA